MAHPLAQMCGSAYSHKRRTNVCGNERNTCMRSENVLHQKRREELESSAGAQPLPAITVLQVSQAQKQGHACMLIYSPHVLLPVRVGMQATERVHPCSL